MNRLSTTERAAIVRALVEGNSIRATCRITGRDKGTVLALLNDLGAVCTTYQSKTLRNLQSERIQCDEIWAFCYAKEKNVPKEMAGRFGVGDVWTWTAIDPDSKLIVCWNIGLRDAITAEIFMADLQSRLAHRVHLTTDGFRGYLPAVADTFGKNVDYGMLVKVYGPTETKGPRRYSPPAITEIKRHRISGNPDLASLSTSNVERANLTMRMGMRRFTRLTNGFSKKLQNHENAVALHFMHYNFARIHQTLRVTPAMAAGVADHVWSIDEICGLLTRSEHQAEAA
jgi:IS1 family transposase